MHNLSLYCNTIKQLSVKKGKFKNGVVVPKAKERPRKYKQKATTIMSIMHVGSSTIDINRLYISAFLFSCMHGSNFNNGSTFCGVVVFF